MATRCRLLLLKLGAAVAAASCLLAASSCGPVDAALPLPPPPSGDFSATTDDTDVQSTVVESGVAAVAAASRSRGSRRLGPPARRLYDIPADAPASDDIIPADAQAPAASPAGNVDDDPLAIFRVFGVVLFFGGGVVVFVLCGVGLHKGAALLASAIADHYAAARAAHEKATRVHPLDEDAGY
jgi:hypothetical protein